MILQISTPQPDIVFEILLNILVFAFYNWLFNSGAGFTKRYKTLQNIAPQSEAPNEPQVPETIAPPLEISVAVEANPHLIGKLGLQMPLESAPTPSLSVKLGLEPPLPAPVVSAPLIASTTISAPIDTQVNEAVATIRQLSLRKCGIDPNSSNAEGELARHLFELNCNFSHPRSLEQWQEIYSTWSTKIALGIAKIKHPVLSTAERRARETAAKQAIHDKKNQFSYKSRGLALQEF